MLLLVFTMIAACERRETSAPSAAPAPSRSKHPVSSEPGTCDRCHATEVAAGATPTTRARCRRRATTLCSERRKRRCRKAASRRACRAATESASCTRRGPTARARLRGALHLRRRAAPAAAAPARSRAAPGDHDRVGCATGRSGRTALVRSCTATSVSRRTTCSTGPGPRSAGTRCAPSVIRRTCARVTGSRRITTTRTWSELTVGCEACHGPGSRHVAWAEATTRGEVGRARRIAPCPSHSRATVRRGRSPTARRSRSARSRGDHTRRSTRAAPCHARRSAHRRSATSTASRSSTRTAPRCSSRALHARRPDPGRGLRVRLVPAEPHARGRRHVQRLPRPALRRAARRGQRAVRAAATSPRVFDVPAHHHHAAGSDAARCVSCHMPTRTYMVVDARHDHSLRVPRPDLSVKLGTPNACNACHADRTPQWAAEARRALVRRGAPPRAALRRGPARGAQRSSRRRGRARRARR